MPSATWSGCGRLSCLAVPPTWPELRRTSTEPVTSRTGCRMAADRPSAVAVIGVSDGRPTVVVAVNDAGRALGLRAGALVLAAAGALGGRGGGKDDVAQGGGAPLGDRADDAINAAFGAVRVLINDIMGAGTVG